MDIGRITSGIDNRELLRDMTKDVRIGGGKTDPEVSGEPPRFGHGPMIDPMLEPYADPQGGPAAAKEPKVSTEYNFGTFNAYGDKGYDLKSEVEEIGNFVAGRQPQGSSPLDVVGFQEVGGQKPGAQIAGEMARNGMNGYMDDGGNPIYWNASKFDVVHQETLVIHEKDASAKGAGVPEEISQDKVPDQRRTTTFVVLKDKETGAEMLVTNRHQDHSIGEWKHDYNRIAHKTMSNIKANQIMENFKGISARVDLGDFNESSGAGSSLSKIGPHTTNPKSLNSNQYDTESGQGIDHILSEGADFQTSASEGNRHYYEAVDGKHFNSDSFSHPMMSQTITVNSSQTELDDASADKSIDGNGAGAVFYEKGGYDGNAWAVGFGRDDQDWKHSDWNDKTSSIALTPDKDITVYKDTNDDSEEGRNIAASTSNVGDEWNDEISAFKW